MAQTNTILRTTPLLQLNNLADNATREKARIPAWCDRVLRKGDTLKQTSYTTAPLNFSDHKPVSATFQCTVTDIDETKKNELSHSIYAKRRLDVGDITANARNDDVDDEDLIGYDSIAPELPPASSDRRKWWLDNGKLITFPFMILHRSFTEWRSGSGSIRYQSSRQRVDCQPTQALQPFYSDHSDRFYKDVKCRNARTSWPKPTFAPSPRRQSPDIKFLICLNCIERCAQTCATCSPKTSIAYQA